MNKLTTNKGESIAETLVAVLITSMALTILAGAIVTAARVNSEEKNQNEAVVMTQYDITPGVHNSDTEVEDLGTVTIRINDSSIGEISVDSSVHKYRTKNGYYFYE